MNPGAVTDLGFAYDQGRPCTFQNELQNRSEVMNCYLRAQVVCLES